MADVMISRELRYYHHANHFLVEYGRCTRKQRRQIIKRVPFSRSPSNRKGFRSRGRA